MSEVISNPILERDMTDNFVCKIYFKDINKIDVRKNGIDPFVIWDSLGYKAFDKNVVPIIINRLISNNENRRFIKYDSATKKVVLTDKGRRWADNNCRTRAGVLG